MLVMLVMLTFVALAATMVAKLAMVLLLPEEEVLLCPRKLTDFPFRPVFSFRPIFVMVVAPGDPMYEGIGDGERDSDGDAGGVGVVSTAADAVSRTTTSLQHNVDVDILSSAWLAMARRNDRLWAMVLSSSWGVMLAGLDASARCSACVPRHRTPSICCSARYTLLKARRNRAGGSVPTPNFAP